MSCPVTEVCCGWDFPSQLERSCRQQKNCNHWLLRLSVLPLMTYGFWFLAESSITIDFFWQILHILTHYIHADYKFCLCVITYYNHTDYKLYLEFSHMLHIYRLQILSECSHILHSYRLQILSLPHITFTLTINFVWVLPHVTFITDFWIMITDVHFALFPCLV